MNVDGDNELLDVVLLGFDCEGDEGALRGLRSVFNMDEARGQALLTKLPTTVARGVPPVRARYLRRALRMVEARVEVRDGAGQTVELSDEAPRPPAPKPKPKPKPKPSPVPEAPTEGAGLGVAATQRPPPMRAGDAGAGDGATTDGDGSPPLATANADPAPSPSKQERGAGPEAFAATHQHIAQPATAPGQGAASNATLIMATQPAASQRPTPASGAAERGTLQEVGTAPAEEHRHTLSDGPDWSSFRLRDPSYIGNDGGPSLGREPSYIDELKPAQAGGGAPALPGGGTGGGAADSTDSLDLVGVTPVRRGADNAMGAPLARDADGNFEVPEETGDSALELDSGRPDSRAAGGPSRGQPVGGRERAASAGGRERAASAGGRAAAPALVEGGFHAVSRGPRPGARAGAPAPAGHDDGISVPPKDGPDRPDLSGYRPPSQRSIDGKPHPAKPGAGRAMPRPRLAPVGGPPPQQQARDDRSFWETLTDALLLPFMGTGSNWVVTITLWAALLGGASGLLDMLPPGAAAIGHIALPALLLATTLAFAADYHRVCVWSVLSHQPEPRESPSLGNLLGDYLASGFQLLLFGLLWYAPLVLWGFRYEWDAADTVRRFIGSPVTLLLLSLPHLYFPMALGAAALGNRTGAIWELGFGFGAILAAPLEYAFIVFVSACATASAAGIVLLLGLQLGFGDWFLLAGLGLPLAVGCGLQGGLIGHLMRARPDAFG